MKKVDQIKMLLHPENYTDEQLDQMLEETDIVVPDANKEWEKLVIEKRKARNVRFPLMKIAAMFIGVLMLSSIAYATIHIISNHSKKPQQELAVTTDVGQQKTDMLLNDSTEMKPVVFEDAELNSILDEIATFYQVEPVFKNEASKHIRLYFTWNKKKTLDDIIDTFNKFERINITRHDKFLIVE